MAKTPLNIASNVAKVYTNGEYTTPPHIEALENAMLGVYHGRIKRLIINMPPRHGKSEYVSKYYVAWYLANRPKHKIILCSYESTYAESWSIKAKAVYKTMRNDLTIDKQEEWLNTSEGGMYAVGAGGPVTGKGANLLIIDDPYKNDKSATSKTQRNTVWDWFKSTAYTRLAPDAAVVIIQTRWHHDDLSGKLIKEQPGKWTVLNMPAIAEPNDALGREVGEALWPEWYSTSTLLEIKETIGSYFFSALYQQRPVASEFQIFKPEWWNFYTTLPQMNFLAQSWDTAFEDNEINDYSCGQTWGINKSGFYLMDLWRGKPQFPELVRQVKLQFNKHTPNVVLIEKKASGASLIQVIKRETTMPIKAIEVLRDKTARANLVSPLHESGKVWLPANAKWVADFIEECSEFPNGQNDDQVDPMTQVLDYLRKRQGREDGSSLADINTIVTKENYYRY
jgi:predicted phage terminase large subunit-like protein